MAVTHPAVGAPLPGRATPVGRVASLARGLPRLGGGWPWRGLSVAVMGPDGAGRSTLADAVAAGYGPPARVVYMGLWQGEGEGPGCALPAALLAAARADYLALAARLPQAVVLDADRPPDALGVAALDRIWQTALTDRGRRS